MNYIAHRDESGNEQSILEHSVNTAHIASNFAVSDLKNVCYEIALLHDIGKYLRDFQTMIQEDKPSRIEHSICGAKEIESTALGAQPLGRLMQLCIAGHHSGIPDMGTKADLAQCATLHGRLKRDTGDYTAYRNEIRMNALDPVVFNRYLAKNCKTQEDMAEKFAFLVRYCFSCLTDADSLDTAEACGEQRQAELESDFAECTHLLNDRLNSFICTTPLQKARKALQKQALERINQDGEIYLMQMPTGSGKTLAGMQCALRLAWRKNLRRIIYVIPYNSIIDQTVHVFEELFGDSAQILRYQSTFSYDEQESLSEDYRETIKKASENWNAQIIITTAVQFFETLYADKRKKLRKLHNMADSVLVFDEAHMMPVDYLQPCLRGIVHITDCLNSKAIFLTATMPDYERLIHEYATVKIRICDLVPDHSMFPTFAKCKYMSLGSISDAMLVEMASNAPSVLIVANSKSGARALYELAQGQKYHLSTYMTGFDRIRTIESIRTALDDLRRDYPDMRDVPEERRIMVVSTSLIEAGVDLDFYEAYRELSGLDSILQTGGRCNREGRMPIGSVYAFERSDARPNMRPEASITRGIFNEFENVSSTEAIKIYYERIFNIHSARIKSKTMRSLCNVENWSDVRIRSYAEHFRLIEDTNSCPVVVCRDGRSQNLRNRLSMTGIINPREIQSYCCTVSRREFEDLLQQGVLNDFGSGIYFLMNDDYYDELTGICVQGKDIYL